MYKNEQEVFDAVVKHAESMEKPSVDVNGLCAYRGENGSKCLVGGLIKDCDYVPLMDMKDGVGGTGVEGLIERGLLPSYLVKYRNLLSYCQSAHDSYKLCHDWKHMMISSLKEVAQDFNLVYTGNL